MSRPEDHNVILLDWSELSAFPWYREAVDNVKMVAGALTRFLETYHDTGEIPIQNVHIVGFSLGAHVAGFAGKSLRPGLRVPRITGLDPAFPDFSLKSTILQVSSRRPRLQACLFKDTPEVSPLSNLNRI